MDEIFNRDLEDSVLGAIGRDTTSGEIIDALLTMTCACTTTASGGQAEWYLLLIDKIMKIKVIIDSRKERIND